MDSNPIIELLGRRLRLAVIGGGPGSFIGAMHRTAARLRDLDGIRWGGVEVTMSAEWPAGRRRRDLVLHESTQLDLVEVTLRSGIPTTDLARTLLDLCAVLSMDDAEYALRAREHGYPTVSLPGAAVWHVNWADKDDAIDWQAYHHARNRILVALLHSPYPRGGKVVWESFQIQVKHALAMQYSSAELRLWAMQDILDGPDHGNLTAIPQNLLRGFSLLRAVHNGSDFIVKIGDRSVRGLRLRSRL